MNGLRATMFTRSDRGIGYLVGATDAPTVVRSYYLDAADSDAVVARAHAARAAAGLLTGHAAGDETEPVTTYNLIRDAETVFGTAERVWLWSEDLLERLAALRPDIYGGWTVDVLARNLRALGVETRQLNRVGPDGAKQCARQPRRVHHLPLAARLGRDRERGRGRLVRDLVDRGDRRYLRPKD